MGIARMCYAVFMRIRRLNHCVYQVQYHIIWTTKFRRKIIKDYVQTELVKSFYRTLKKYPDWYLHEVNTGSDHVHLLIEFPPKYPASEVVQKLKAYSSVDLSKRFKFIRSLYADGNVWSTGYFVSTIGFNEKLIKAYIQNQGQYDRGKDVSSEFS